MEIIDFHSHILPGIDDGSADTEESLEMLRLEAAQGIGHVVATPHFYPRHDNPRRFLERRAQAEKLLLETIGNEGMLPRISLGAEVYYFSGISDSEVLSQLTIDKKRFILLEMPQSPWTDSMYREIEQIWVKQGITPIIAHVDRYISPFRTHRIPEQLSGLPVLVQANASFFLKTSTRKMALRMLKNDQIHLLGSDCHNLTDRRPNLGDALAVIRKHSGEKAVQQIRNNQTCIFKP